MSTSVYEAQLELRQLRRQLRSGMPQSSLKRVIEILSLAPNAITNSVNPENRLLAKLKEYSAMKKSEFVNRLMEDTDMDELLAEDDDEVELTRLIARVNVAGVDLPMKKELEGIESICTSRQNDIGAVLRQLAAYCLRTSTILPQEIAGQDIIEKLGRRLAELALMTREARLITEYRAKQDVRNPVTNARKALRRFLGLKKQMFYNMEETQLENIKLKVMGELIKKNKSLFSPEVIQMAIIQAKPEYLVNHICKYFQEGAGPLTFKHLTVMVDLVTRVRLDKDVREVAVEFIKQCWSVCKLTAPEQRFDRRELPTTPV